MATLALFTRARLLIIVTFGSFMNVIGCFDDDTGSFIGARMRLTC